MTEKPAIGAYPCTPRDNGATHVAYDLDGFTWPVSETEAERIEAEREKRRQNRAAQSSL